MTESPQDLAARLNLETGRLEWAELQRHFARGIVLVVAPDLDLTGVAAALVRDDRPAVAAWKDGGRLRAAADDDARRWHSGNASFRAVVVAPWVLVQETEA